MIAVYFFTAILFILLAAVLVAPMLERTVKSTGSDADARLAAAIEALREIEFEHETGKLETADYEAMRADLARAAIAARDAGARGSDEAAEAGGLVCAVCGAGAAEGTRFCTRCGTAFGDTG